MLQIKLLVEVRGFPNGLKAKKVGVFFRFKGSQARLLGTRNFNSLDSTFGGHFWAGY
jgi:hypothetical protein